MPDPWFVPKSHGYGAQPANWKGWAAVGLFVIYAVVLTLWLLIPGEGQAFSVTNLIVWLVVLPETS